MQATASRSSAPISSTLLVALAVSAVLAGAVAGIGILASFHTVSAQMRPGFQSWAWTVPVTLDMSIASFSILELALLRMALPHLLARMAVYAATGATVYLNTRDFIGQGDHTELVAHAAMPAVWAVYIEVLRAAAATRMRRQRQHTEHPLLALLLAPRLVLAVWRHGILACVSPPRTRTQKMSAASGHFSTRSDLRDLYSVRDGADIIPGAPKDQAPVAAPLCRDGSTRVDQPARIGKGRGLTGRHAVLDLVRRHPDLTSAQIAERLNLAPRTVRRHLGRR
jgi:DNA-binding CsgD family transcriptional regulator